MYELQKRSYYKNKYFKKESHRLFREAWKTYRGYLRGSIDNPLNDKNVCEWISQLISEKNNNFR